MAIARIDITGNINDRLAVRISPMLDYISAKKKYKALLLVINSPGGGATASEIISHKIQNLSEKKPVISVITGLGASGAYWISASTNRIFALRTSLVGSIGIISILPSFKQFLDRLGIKVDIAKIGEYKSMTSPFEERTDQQKAHMTEMLQDVFEGFKNDIISKRKIGSDKIGDIINGDIFSAKKAIENNLIDEIGGVEDAVNYIRTKLKVGGPIKNLSPRPSLVNRFVGGGLRELLEDIIIQ
jgi:protease-4